MKWNYLMVIPIVLMLFLVSAVHAQISIPTNAGVSSNGFSLGALTSGNSALYAGFFAIVMFIIFAIALDRTQLSSGRIAISLMFALITFFLLYSDSTLLHFFLNTFIVLGIIALILGMLALVRSPRSIRLIGLVVALFLIYILFENDTGLTNSVDSLLHIQILTILPLILGGAAVLVIIILLMRGIKNHHNPVLRVALAFIIFLLIALLIPGFAAFLFSPIVLVPLAIAIFAAIYLIIKISGPHKPKLSKEYKKQQKIAKIQGKALSSIQNRKQANAPILQEYRDLLKKGNLSPNEQLRMAQLKNQLANSAWQNVADRTQLSAAQYSRKELSNNKDLRKLTGFFSRQPALRDLKSAAKSNYKMTRAEKKELKHQSKFYNAANTSGNANAQDLFQMANAVKGGAFGAAMSDKQARRLFEKRMTKDARRKDVSDLMQERQKIADTSLNLSNSTRKKLLKGIDKRLSKLTNNKFNQQQLLNEQKQQLRQEMAEDDRLTRAQLEAARASNEANRRIEEQASREQAAREEKARQDALREQARMAQAAREEKARQDALREQARMAQAAKMEEERRNREIQEEIANKKNTKDTTSPVSQPGPTSAFDKRIKTPLWFSPKSPVDENGKLDVMVQNEIELNGLTHRKEDLINNINSGKLSERDLKNAKNELNRIDYRLKKYGREIHR